MAIGLRRGKQLPPIQIPNLERRQQGREDALEATIHKTSSLPPTPTLPTLTSQDVLLYPTTGSSSNAPSNSNFSPSLTTLAQAPVRSTSSLGEKTSVKPSIPASQPTTTSGTTISQPPAKTTIVTVTQSIGSPKEKQETPGATKTVFSNLPLIVTVTASEQTPNSSASSIGAPRIEGANALPPGAVKPLIALSTIAGASAFSILAIILWRRKKKSKKTLSEVEKLDRAILR